MIDGEPWWVAKDVCDVLEIVNVTDALRSLDDDERSRFNLGRQGDANIVNESGLYRLIFKSRKPEAEQFRKWVTREVLPTIRKTGSYGTAQPAELTRTQILTMALEAEQAASVILVSKRIST